MMCDSFSEDSAFRTYSICNELRKNPKTNLKGIGVILTMVDKGAATRETREECQRVLGSTLFKTEIPSALAVKTSVSESSASFFIPRIIGCNDSLVARKLR